MKPDVNDLIRENDRRLAQVRSTSFDPVTGEGSTGKRAAVDIPGADIPRQWLPEPMLDTPLVRLLRKHGGVDGLITNHLHAIPDDDTRRNIRGAIVRLRCRYDFPFWAATLAYIKNKKTGQPDCLFRLNNPQRRYISFLESMRLADKPIRVCMLKARQWGGSTATQIYMAWLQLVHRPSLNSLIIAHETSASSKIKAMFHKLLDAYPAEMLHDIADTPAKDEKKLVWDGNSDSTQRVPQRNCTISIGSAESPNSARGGDYSLVHVSEIGLFKDTVKIHPADLIRSATSGVLYQPYTMIVYESTADGVGTFFHDEWKAATDGHSQFQPFFVPWFEIEEWSLPFDSDRERAEFAQRLIDGRESQAVASNREEPGSFLWYLWRQGATLEAIHWYTVERSKYSQHGKMAAEFPSNPIEAFVNNGASVFDPNLVNALRSTCRPPARVGDIYSNSPLATHHSPLTTTPSLDNLVFRDDSQGELSVWSLPDPPAPSVAISDRYLAVVDIGGRTANADFSVVLVLDRLEMADNGGRPIVAAQWYGHTDIDLLAWKAAQIAAFYDNALLVIESNTLDSRDPNRHVEGGDQSLYLFNQLAAVYPNLYARRQSDEEIRQGIPRRYGFNTNAATKPMIISHLIRCVRERLYFERDERALDELLVYEKRPNGSYAASVGHHDDLLMARAIGLHICHNEMPLPQIVPVNSRDRYRVTPRIISEASI